MENLVFSLPKRTRQINKYILITRAQAQWRILGDFSRGVKRFRNLTNTFLELFTDKKKTLKLYVFKLLSRS